MISDQQKLEHLTKMGEMLRQVLEEDIAQLEAGRPKHMRINDPDIQKLTVVYSREIKAVDPEAARAAPRELRRRFAAVTRKVHELLPLHMRYLMRVRRASEGIIKAVADDVERKRNANRPYVSPTSRYRPPPSAIVYNNVV